MSDKPDPPPWEHDPELTAKMRAAGHELVQTLGQWQALDGLAWDVLGERLVVRFRAGLPGRKPVPVDWLIPHALAKDLLSQLAQVIEEKERATPTRQ